MKRREFLSVLGGAAAWSLEARAQQPTMPLIGFLNGGSPKGYGPWLAAFRRGLKEAGYVEGQNVAIEYRWAEGEFHRLPALAADLVHSRVTVLAATSTPAAIAARAATTTIPVVFTTSNDPVRLGLVSSLSRPGGNVTGAVQVNVEIASKRLELLHELLPTARVIGLLVNPTNPTAETQTRDLQAAARALRRPLHILYASADGHLDQIFASLAELRIGGLAISSADPFFTSRSEQLAALTVQHAVPAIYQYREFVAAGGLISYGGSITDTYRLAGIYTGRILKGEKPAELPVQQGTKIELFINLKTARALGLDLPAKVLALADEVIE